MISFQLSNIEDLKSIFTFICELSQNINMNFNKTGIDILVMDVTKTCMSKIKLTDSYFDKYNSESETVIGVDCQSFVKILKMCDVHSELSCSYNFSDYIEFNIKNGSHVTKLKLKLLDLEVDEINISDLGYKTSILMDITKLCTDLNNIKTLNGIDCNLNIDQEYVKIDSYIESGEIEFTYKIKGNNDIKIFKYTKCDDIKLSINKVLSLSKLNTISNLAIIGIGDDLPLFVKYSLSSNSYIKYWIAPKMSDYE